MTTVIIALLILLLIAPGVVATYVVLIYLMELSPALYVVCLWLALGFTAVIASWGAFWFTPSAEEHADLRSVTHHHGSSFQEKNHEKRQESEVRS